MVDEITNCSANSIGIPHVDAVEFWIRITKGVVSTMAVELQKPVWAFQNGVNPEGKICNQLSIFEILEVNRIDRTYLYGSPGGRVKLPSSEFPGLTHTFGFKADHKDIILSTLA